MRWGWLVLVCAFATTAWAKEVTVATVKTSDGRSFRVYWTDAPQLRVARNGRSVSARSLGFGVMNESDVKAKATGNRVRLVGSNICGDVSTELDADAIDARIENASGFRLHRAKKFKEAIAKFEKAQKLDGDFAIAATNLASAQVLSGDLDAADETIKKELSARPLKTFLKVLSDSELTPLQARPMFRSRVDGGTGTAQVSSRSTLGTGLAYASKHDWLAFVLHAPPGGAACTDRSFLVVVKAASGETVFRTPIATHNEMDRPRACDRTRTSKRARAKGKERLARVNLLLKAHDFEPLATETSRGGAKLLKARFATSKIGVVASNTHVRAFRSGKLVGEAKSGPIDSLDGGLYAKSIGKAVVFWSYDCAHNADEAYAAVVAISKKP